MIRNLVLKPWENVVLYLSGLFFYFLLVCTDAVSEPVWPVTFGGEVEVFIRFPAVGS